METQKENKRLDKKIIALCLMLALVIFVVDSLLPLGVAGGVPYILVVLVALWSPREKLPVFLAVLVSILTLAGYLTSPSGGEIWKVLFNRFLALFAIWTTAILSVQRETMQKEKEKALFEVKVLSGLLPICASYPAKKSETTRGNGDKLKHTFVIVPRLNSAIVFVLTAQKSFIRNWI